MLARHKTTRPKAQEDVATVEADFTQTEMNVAPKTAHVTPAVRKTTTHRYAAQRMSMTLMKRHILKRNQATNQAKRASTSMPYKPTYKGTKRS